MLYFCFNAWFLYYFESLGETRNERPTSTARFHSSVCMSVGYTTFPQWHCVCGYLTTMTTLVLVLIAIISAFLKFQALEKCALTVYTVVLLADVCHHTHSGSVPCCIARKLIKIMAFPCKTSTPTSTPNQRHEESSFLGFHIHSVVTRWRWQNRNLSSHSNGNRMPRGPNLSSAIFFGMRKSF